MGMKRKRQLSSVIFHAGACILGILYDLSAPVAAGQLL